MWSGLGLNSDTLKLITEAGYAEPTPVQKAAIPKAIEGRDLLVSAKTGSGKTASFCLPMIEKIKGRKGTLGLVLCPTREIALQTQEVLVKFALPQGITSMSVIGGVGMRSETKALMEYPQILVATPGKLCDHFGRGNIWLEYIEVIVLDEADKMLDMGFAKELEIVMDAIPEQAQTLFFSATINKETEKLARAFLNNPERVSIESSIKVADTVQQELLWVNERSKLRELIRILREVNGTVIVFTATKKQAHDLWRELYRAGFKDADFLSSDKPQNEREKTVARFKQGETTILVATDVAGRGLDVDDVAHVVNYDFPGEPEDYVHRVGRTGRNKKTGMATTFVTPRDSKTLLAVEALLKAKLPEKRAYDYKYQAPRKSYRR